MNKTKVTRMECPKADWKRVVNAARRTWGKSPIDREPSDGFKKRILIAEHSPIRLLEYDFTLADIAQWVTVHLARHHEGCEKFVHTQRHDINGDIKERVEKIMEIVKADFPRFSQWTNPRDFLFQGERNDMDMTCNAQAFINISRKRLCAKASYETRLAWKAVVSALREVDPHLASVCIPECIYRGFCPELESCGYYKTDLASDQLKEYRNTIGEDRNIKI